MARHSKDVPLSAIFWSLGVIGVLTITFLIKFPIFILASVVALRLIVSLLFNI